MGEYPKRYIGSNTDNLLLITWNRYVINILYIIP